MFLKFANFYQQFILGFSWIAALLTSILKTSKGTESKTRSGESGVRVGGDNKVECGKSEIDKSEIDDVEDDGGKVEVDEVGKKVQKSFKSKNLSKFKKTVRSLDFLTLGAKLAFTKLRQAFLKASIFYHFDPERHIRIETYVSGYAIGRILKQQDLGWFESMAPGSLLLLKDNSVWNQV